MHSSRSSEESHNWHISPLHSSPSSANGPTFSPRPNRTTTTSMSDGISRITRQSTSSTKREKSCDWEGRDDEECIFHSKSGVMLCESSNSKDATRDMMNESECKVFNHCTDGYTIPTRRLVIRSLANPQLFISCCKPIRPLNVILEYQYSEHYTNALTGLPPDNVLIFVRNARIQLEWSDCTHIVQRTKGYKDIFSCVSTLSPFCLSNYSTSSGV